MCDKVTVLLCGTRCDANESSLFSGTAFIVRGGTQFLPALHLLLLAAGLLSFVLCVCVFLSSVF